MMAATLRDALAAFPTAVLRPARDRDADGLIALVSEAYAEYPGCVLDLPGVDADLVAPATSAEQAGTTLWVVEDGGRIVGSVGAGRLVTPEEPGSNGTRSDRVEPAGPGTVELKRLYVAASHRRRGLAAGLIERVEGHAAEVGAATVELWSDTRFTDAHRLYERCGYRRSGRTRELGDPSQTTEYHFQRDLRRPPPA
jgi:GNAT superfamily N-acetyltransferase